MTLKSFKDIRKTPAMVADTVAKACLSKSLSAAVGGRPIRRSRIENIADSCGLGKMMVRSNAQFKAALWLAR